MFTSSSEKIVLGPWCNTGGIHYRADRHGTEWVCAFTHLSGECRFYIYSHWVDTISHITFSLLHAKQMADEIAVKNGFIIAPTKVWCML